MATLDDLLNLNGAVAAGEFTVDGKLVDYKATMDISPEFAATWAQFCPTVTMLFNTLGAAFSRLSHLNCVPQSGWMYVGGDWAVAIGGNRAVFVERANADFNQLYQEVISGQQR